MKWASLKVVHREREREREGKKRICKRERKWWDERFLAWESNEEKSRRGKNGGGICWEGRWIKQRWKKGWESWNGHKSHLLRDSVYAQSFIQKWRDWDWGMGFAYYTLSIWNFDNFSVLFPLKWLQLLCFLSGQNSKLCTVRTEKLVDILSGYSSIFLLFHFYVPYFLTLKSPQFF